jgi:hypothetical protein
LAGSPPSGPGSLGDRGRRHRPGDARQILTVGGPDLIDWGPMQNALVKRLMWSGLMAGLGAVASVATNKVAAIVWRRLFDEEPPE